jgi:hypothetical protein
MDMKGSSMGFLRGRYVMIDVCRGQWFVDEVFRFEATAGITFERVEVA